MGSGSKKEDDDFFHRPLFVFENRPLVVYAYFGFFWLLILFWGTCKKRKWFPVEF